MIYNEIKTGLRVYEKLEQQDRFINNASAVYDYRLIAPYDAILPFQFKTVFYDGEDYNVDSWEIFNIDGTLYEDISDNRNKLEHKTTADEVEYTIYKGDVMEINMPEGYYYSKIVISGHTFFTEVFYVPCGAPSIQDNNSRYAKIEYWNNCDLGDIVYQTGYKSIFFIDATIVKEEPTIEEEAEEDGMGSSYNIFQKYVSNLTMEILAPFHLADTLILLPMHDNVILYMPFNDYNGAIKNIRPTMTKQESGEYYTFSILFQQDTVYVKTACCKNIQLA